MNGFPPRPTLADVAAAAAVSPITVSRVVDGSTKVTESTRRKVEAAMEKIGYYGNAAASNLVSGRGGAIGIVASNTADYGYASTILGIEKAARERELPVLITVIEGSDPLSVRKSVRTVASHALSGVVVLDFDASAHAILPALPAYLPVAVVSSAAEGSGVDLPYVWMDERVTGTLAAQHLIELGHRSIFILAPHDASPSERRSLGMLDALTEARLPHYPLLRCKDWRAKSGYEGTMELLDRYGSQVTAVACANDEVALGSLRALADRGLRVPEDVSVIGFDDNPLAGFTSPPLTTIRQDFERLGSLAFDLLGALLIGAEQPEQRAVEPELMVRASTGAPNPERGL